MRISARRHGLCAGGLGLWVWELPISSFFRGEGLPPLPMKNIKLWSLFMDDRRIKLVSKSVGNIVAGRTRCWRESAKFILCTPTTGGVWLVQP